MFEETGYFLGGRTTRITMLWHELLKLSSVAHQYTAFHGSTRVRARNPYGKPLPMIRRPPTFFPREIARSTRFIK